MSISLTGGKSPGGRGRSNIFQLKPIAGAPGDLWQWQIGNGTVNGVELSNSADSETPFVVEWESGALQVWLEVAFKLEQHVWPFNNSPSFRSTLGWFWYSRAFGIVVQSVLAKAGPAGWPGFPENGFLDEDETNTAARKAYCLLATITDNAEKPDVRRRVHASLTLLAVVQHTMWTVTDSAHGQDKATGVNQRRPLFFSPDLLFAMDAEDNEPQQMAAPSGLPVFTG